VETLPYIVLGSALGGIARYGLSGLVARLVGESFPWGTMVVNVSGALAIGIIAGATQASAPDANVWALVVIGFLGSYTTVSSFSVQTLMLLRDGERGRALANVVLSLGLCLGAVAVGFLFGTAASEAWSRG
jgi:fluoride exporter